MATITEEAVRAAVAVGYDQGLADGTEMLADRLLRLEPGCVLPALRQLKAALITNKLLGRHPFAASKVGQ